jgi:hypothetical protein
MIRIICTLAASSFTFLAASCCCTSDAKPPGLRPLSQFQEIQADQPSYSPAPRIRGTK